MKNGMTFFRSPLDLFVAKIPAHERHQIMLDFDELERTGQSGDTALRRRAGEAYRAIQICPGGFDALFMMLVGYSVHKLASIEAVESKQALPVSA